MAKKKRTVVGLKCTETGKVNYTVYKPNTPGNEKLEVMKFNPDLKRHTKHVETKLD